MSIDRTQGQFELQANDFADRNFHQQHGGNSGLADVDRVSPHHTGIARVDADVDLQLEARMPPSVHEVVTRTGLELPAHYQFDSLYGS